MGASPRRNSTSSWEFENTVGVTFPQLLRKKINPLPNVVILTNAGKARERSAQTLNSSRGETFLPSDNANQELEEREYEHNCWLAMQSAYTEYRRASELFEHEHQGADPSGANDHSSLPVSEGLQRVAFEQYLEARMQFLECRFDRSYPPGGAPLADRPEPLVEGGGEGRWVALGRYKPILQMLALALLCTTATSLVQEQRRVRGLETARDEVRETLKQTKSELQLLNQRLEAREPLQHITSPRIEQTQSAPAGTQAPRRIGPKGRPLSRVQKSQHPALQKRGPEAPGSDSTPRTYRFSLSPSPQSRNVGPLKVILRSINRSRSSVSLSVTSNKTAISLPSLQLNQPIGVDVGNRQPGVELVVDRIQGNLVNGHVTESRRKDQPELRAELFTRP